ncbi:DUF4347 domain-containing protein, partial [Stratiformator vulcanicus]|uniref:DUF4347 domain-containing protein n=1 Tax=Stratiformator vulcanicus TaxID=2527980 RepID=UPI0011AA3E42
MANRNRPVDEQPPLLMRLEPRIMFSATPVGVAVDGALPDGGGDDASESDDPLHSPEGNELTEADGSPDVSAEPLFDLDVLPPVPEDVRHELVIVDPATEDYQQILDDLAGSDDPMREIEIVLLDANRDGVEQLSEIFAERDDLDAVHLISHGRDGEIRLGDTWLDSDRLAQDADSIAAWGSAFAADGDLLLYGCDLAATASGRSFLSALSATCDCDVAASSDETGIESRGGDWDLEYAKGLIETEIVLSTQTQQTWDALLEAGTSGTAIWGESGTNTPEVSDWDGISFGAESIAANVGQWRIIDGAEAPTRDELIAVGVTSAGTISGQMFDGSSWTALPFSLDTVSSGTNHGFDIEYESQSGDAVLVWNNGSTGSSPISYRVWDGSSWSTEQTISTPQSGEATELQLASNPLADEMTLVVSNSSADEYALIWDGSGWGNSVTLDTGVSGDRTEIQVAYESLSGDAIVIYDGISGGSGL